MKKTSLNEQALQNLTSLYKAAAVVLILAAGATALLMKNTPYPLTTAYLTSDSLASQQTTVFVAAERTVMSLGIRDAMLVVLIISAAALLISTQGYPGRYRRALKDKVNPARWIGLAISGALAVEIIAMLSGIHDFWILKLMAGLIGVTALLGWLAEKENSSSNRPVWLAFGLSVLTGGLPWLVIIGTMASNWFYGAVRLPWYSFAAAAVLLVGFCGFALNQCLGYKKRGQWADYAWVDRNYLFIGTLTKLALAAVLILGFKR